MNFNLIQKRMERGLTQKKVAEAIGISAMAIGLYEKGMRIPRPEIKKKLANFYGCEESELFGEVPDKRVDYMTEDIKNGKFHIFDENGELAVDKYSEYLLNQRIEADGEEYFPLENFEKLMYCEIYKMLKQLTGKGKAE